MDFDEPLPLRVVWNVLGLVLRQFYWKDKSENWYKQTQTGELKFATPSSLNPSLH